MWRLISRRVVLSAAHCFRLYMFPQNYRVVLGSSFRSSGGVAHHISNIINHPEYGIQSLLDADVAVIRLSNLAELSSSVATIPIASSVPRLPAGMPVTVIGWGLNKSGGDPSEQLQHVQVYVVDQEVCAKRYERVIKITAGMACAGILDVGGKDACQQDSGGPYIHVGSQKILVGIVSGGRGCADGYFPGIMARVSFYSDWIVETANRQ